MSVSCCCSPQDGRPPTLDQARYPIMSSLSSSETSAERLMIPPVTLLVGVIVVLIGRLWASSSFET